MPPSRRSLGVRAQLDREIRELDRERERLLAARAALEGKAVIPQARPPQITQDQVAAYLAEHPNSRYTEIATALGARPTVIAAHLNRGQKSGRFLNTDDGWNLKG
jgi:DNA invertase Pin-like site-specific DNA recombinase